MSYTLALKAAGAKIINYFETRDYQGSWVALVEFNGERGIVRGSFGSCTGCDAFQSEFYGGPQMPEMREGKWYREGRTWDEDSEISPEEAVVATEIYQQRLSDFGLSYLTPPLYTKQYFENKITEIESKGTDWFDSEEKEICEAVINFDW